MYDVVIPWRTDNGPRERIFEWVVERWRMRCPGAVLHIVDDGSEQFSRAGSRNSALDNLKTDVVVFADADTPPIPAFLERSIQKANDGVWSLPFGEREYYNLNQVRTDIYLHQSPSTDIRRPHPNAVEHQVMAWAGILVAPVEAVQRVGGYDERFKGWGHEDVAFRLSLDHQWGQHERIDDGYVVHFWHPREDATFDTEQELANRRLFDLEYRRRYRWKDERHLL